MQEKKENNQKIENQKTKKCYCNSKTKKIIAIIFAIIIIAFFIWVLTLKGPKGAQEDWISNLSQEDLDKIHLLNKNVDIPTRTTPEQTYAALKEALKNEDVDTAVNCFAEEKRGEWRESLKKIKEKGFMQEMEQDLTELNLELEGNTIMTYTFNNIDSVGDVTPHHISFIKDSNGDWKIESL